MYFDFIDAMVKVLLMGIVQIASVVTMCFS
jgi:hypothetical protein